MHEILQWIADRTAASVPVLWVLAGLLLAMVLGSIVRISVLRFSADRKEKQASRLGSLLVWWILALLLAAIALIGVPAAVLFFFLASVQGIREFRRMAKTRIGTPHHWIWAFAAIPIHYWILANGWLGPFWTFIPVWVLLILLVRLVVTGEIENFMESVGITFFGMMLIVFLFSHGALLLTLPDDSNPGAGAIGYFLFLVILTEGNDIAQALWGRRFGRHKIIPRVSPGKSWEGFLLGAASTVGVACLLALLLTPFAAGSLHFGSVVVEVPYLPAILAGGMIAIGGFFGDIVMSAVKREVGVKDSGTLLPGQGGILDRIDSLTFTAPLFFYFITIFIL